MMGSVKGDHLDWPGWWILRFFSTFDDLFRQTHGWNFPQTFVAARLVSRLGVAKILRKSWCAFLVKKYLKTRTFWIFGDGDCWISTSGALSDKVGRLTIFGSRNYRNFWIVTPPSKLRGLISDRFFCDDQIIPYPSMNWRLVSERYFFAKTLEPKKKFLAQWLSEGRITKVSTRMMNSPVFLNFWWSVSPNPRMKFPPNFCGCSISIEARRGEIFEKIVMRVLSEKIFENSHILDFWWWRLLNLY